MKIKSVQARYLKYSIKKNGVHGKICKHCNKWKPLKSLLANKRSSFGRQRFCYTCQDDYRDFGLKVAKVLVRDGYKCVCCGITNAQHLKKWGYRITIDHIDGNGSNVGMKKKNNDIKNLQSLCSVCHGKKDWKRRLL